MRRSTRTYHVYVSVNRLGRDILLIRSNYIRKMSAIYKKKKKMNVKFKNVYCKNDIYRPIE